jgi:two-component system CheB/CheR fusion protein
MYGYSRAEALNMNIRDLIPQEKRKQNLELMKKICAGKEIKSFQTRRKTKDGKALDIWLTVTIIADAAGKPIQIATTERDLAWLSKQ